MQASATGARIKVRRFNIAAAIRARDLDDAVKRIAERHQDAPNTVGFDRPEVTPDGKKGNCMTLRRVKTSWAVVNTLPIGDAKLCGR